MSKKPLNPQLKAAIFVAPFLFIIGYIASDYFAKQDQPKDALFQLHTANDRCDFGNNDCRFSNGGLSLSVTLEERFDDGSSLLRVVAEEDLRGVAIALTDIDADTTPVTMVSRGGPRQWQVSVQVPLTIFPYLRLVVSTDKGFYYGEAPVEM
jgi:hypothetical protein